MAFGKGLELDDWKVQAVLSDNGTLEIFISNDEGRVFDVTDDTERKEVFRTAYRCTYGEE